MPTPVDVSDAITDAANSALEGMLPEAPEPSESDATSEDTPDPTPTATAEPEGEATPEDTPAAPVTLPEGYVTVPTIGDSLATEFELYDPEGAVEIPALQVEYKANGKVRRDRLDQVVKLAQMGVYNHQREVAREQEAHQQMASLQERLAVREQQIERLLTDESLYSAARDQYLDANTPEQRAHRLAEENAALRQAQEVEQHRVQASNFYNNELLPSIQEITKAFPEVSEDELAAYIAVAAQPMMERGMVNPRHYDTLRNYLLNELVPWARSTNTSRTAKIEAARQSVSKKAEAAQVSAQKAKRAVGKVVKPGSRGLPATNVKSKPNASIDDAVDDALDSVLSSLSLST